jgi:hypothetical protein
MERKPKNLGRAYLVGKLQERGLSRRQAVGILNFTLHEMAAALKRGREVEFPFGPLKRVKHASRRWQMIDDDPMQPYSVEHELDGEGDQLLNGIEAPETGPGRR